MPEIKVSSTPQPVSKCDFGPRLAERLLGQGPVDSSLAQAQALPERSAPADLWLIAKALCQNFERLAATAAALRSINDLFGQYAGLYGAEQRNFELCRLLYPLICKEKFYLPPQPDFVFLLRSLEPLTWPDLRPPAGRPLDYQMPAAKGLSWSEHDPDRDSNLHLTQHLARVLNPNGPLGQVSAQPTKRQINVWLQLRQNVVAFEDAQPLSQINAGNDLRQLLGHLLVTAEAFRNSRISGLGDCKPFLNSLLEPAAKVEVAHDPHFVTRAEAAMAHLNLVQLNPEGRGLNGQGQSSNDIVAKAVDRWHYAQEGLKRLNIDVPPVWTQRLMFLGYYG